MLRVIQILCLFFLLQSCDDHRPKFTTENGTRLYIFPNKNRGNEKLEYGNYILCDLLATDSRDSIFLNTLEKSNKLDFLVKETDTIHEFFQALTRLNVGDSALVEIVADSFYGAFGQEVPKYIKKSSIINLKFAIRDQLNPQEFHAHKLAFERLSIKKYLERNRWNFGEVEGIIFERLVSNSYAKARIGDQVSFNYLFKTINDRIIGKNKENDYLKLKLGDKSHIRGLDKILSQMGVGEKCRAIIPSNLAFGKEGSKIIEPYTPLVVEIELVKIEK